MLKIIIPRLLYRDHFAGIAHPEMTNVFDILILNDLHTMLNVAATSEYQIVLYYAIPQIV